MVNRLARWLLVLLTLGVFSGTAVCASTVIIVATERSAGYLDVAKYITNELARSGATSEPTLFSADEWTQTEAALANQKVIVTLGADALAQVLRLEPRAPVVAALLPRIGYERIVRESGRRSTANLSAVFLDQPFARRIELVQLILPDAKRIGVLWGPESVASQSRLTQSAASRGLSIKSGMVANPAGIFSGLKAVLDESDVLLAVADPQVYSSATIANILLATYRARIPLIAFSPAYVKAGALIAIYATPSQIGLQAAGLVRMALQGNVLPPPQYPNEFEISVNEHVARSLGLSLDSRVLTEKLMGGAKRP